MLKMLIVEDEKWEREGLLDFLDWKSFGLEVIETAGDGIEGLEKAEKIRPDIIITDIKMPGMDGISMSKKIKAAMPQVKIIILTGYDDFKLAQEAISFKADAYILKPLEEAELTPVLQKVVAVYIREKEISAKEDLIKKQLAENLYIAKTKFLNDLLEGDIELDHLHQQLSDFGVKTSIHEEYTIVIIKMIATLGESRYRPDRSGDHKFAGMDMILSVTESILQKHLIFSLPFIKEGQTACCLCNPPGDHALFLSKIAEIFQAIHNGLGYLSVIGIGEPAANLNEVSRSFAQARQAVEFGVFWSSCAIIYYKQIDSMRRKFVESESKFLIQGSYFSKQLISSVRSANEDRLFELLKEMFRYIRENQGADRDFVVNYLQSIINEISMFLYTINKGFVCSSTGKTEQGIKLAGLWSLRSMEENLTGFFENTLKKINTKKSNNDEQIIKKVVKLIEERYMSDLGLQIIAREVFLSPNYLGNIFKKCTGKTFNDYLCECRMEKAKELLKLPKKKVSWVASEVGISNTSYFCTIFKNTYGMAPREYQETVLRNL
jgi:two-component system, response regulator YesN